MPPQHQSNELLSELEEHNDFFDNVVNMIPASLYVAGNSGDGAYNSKYLKGQHKESKEARKARNKIAKREKFDPEKMETTLETKRRLRQEQEENDDSDNDSDIVMSDGDGQDEDETGGSTGVVDGNKAETPIKTENYASRIEMLRAKLHAKMAEKRAAAGISSDAQSANGNGGAAVDTSSPALVSKRAARRAEKKKRKDAAKQRNQKKATSVAEKSSEPQRVINLGGSTYNAAEPSGKASKKTAAEDLATIDFQSLAGLKPKLDAAFDNKSLNSKLNKKKSLEKLLADAERKQQRLKELKASSDKEDREKAQNIEWGDALKSAEGKNTRKTTDPKLLKKQLKQKAKKKAASAKTWGDRLDQAKEKADKKQQIRSHNLDARRQGGTVGANLSSKRIKGKDDDEEGGEKGGKRRRLGPHSNQGRNRAGFEGKKQGFINGDSSGGGDKGKQ